MPPVVHSIFAAEDLCRQMAARYDLGAYEHGVLWRGFINDVYRLEASGRRWWLRVAPARWRSVAETRAEVEVLLAIAEVDDVAVRPVALTDGGYVSTVTAPEGERAVVLFEHAAGGNLDYFGEDGERNARRYGEAVGRLRAACRSLPAFTARPPFDVEAVITAPARVVEAALVEGEVGDFRRIVGRLEAVVAGRSDLTVGFCHGDLNCENIHFDGEAVRAIDFDLCADGFRAFELAAFSKGVSHAPREQADRLIGAFFDGYHRHGGMSAGDLVVLPAMTLAQRIWVGAIHMGLAPRFGAQGYGRGYVERLMGWLREWEAILDAPPVWARAR